jgi:hypothetical protein
MLAERKTNLLVQDLRQLHRRIRLDRYLQTSFFFIYISTTLVFDIYYGLATNVVHNGFIRRMGCAKG